jgi:hypothetical protein
MHGVTAAIYWGYQLAAHCSDWELAAGVLTATIPDPSSFALTQSPLVFVVDNSASGRPDMRRELLDVVLEGSTLTARFGPRK